MSGDVPGAARAHLAELLVDESRDVLIAAAPLDVRLVSSGKREYRPDAVGLDRLLHLGTELEASRGR
jgi:hypothetical protein